MANEGEGLGGMQQKQRYINILSKQIQQRNQDIGEKQGQLEKLKETAQELNDKLNSVRIIGKHAAQIFQLKLDLHSDS